MKFTSAFAQTFSTAIGQRGMVASQSERRDDGPADGAHDGSFPGREPSSNNINLTYGSSGFSFADPGAYEVTALLATGEVTDPVAATIVRAQALDARREYVRFQDGEYRHLGADEDRAAGLLGRLGDASLQAFDAVTARGTQSLAESYRSG